MLRETVSTGAGGPCGRSIKRHQAESALRRVASLAGPRPSEYALHSLQSGGATQFAAGGAPPEDLLGERDVGQG